MPYIHITSSPGLDRATYDRVVEQLGPEPIDGQLVHAVGEADGSLHIVDVWETKAHADRFAAERLFAAFERAGLGPGPETSYVAMDGTVRLGAAPVAG